MSAPHPPTLPPEHPLRPGVDAVTIVLAGAAEGALAWAAATGMASWPEVLVGHGGVVAILILWAVLRGWVGKDTRIATWLAWMTLTLGPAGPVATALLVTMTMIFTLSAKPFEEWYESLFPDDEETHGELLYQRLLAGREGALAEGSVSSLTDILFNGPTRAKQAVVALLARRFRAEFAPALQMALVDPEPVIRVQAATAVSTIEERYHTARLELEDNVRAAPHDADAHLALARHLDEYAYAGVLDADRQRATMSDALVAFSEANRRLGARTDVDLAIGRLLLRIGRNEEAELHLSGLSLRNDDPRVLMWHAESLFRLRRFHDLRRVLDDPDLQQLGLTEEYGELNPVINLWQISALFDLGPAEARP